MKRGNHSSNNRARDSADIESGLYLGLSVYGSSHTKDYGTGSVGEMLDWRSYFKTLYCLDCRLCICLTGAPAHGKSQAIPEREPKSSAETELLRLKDRKTLNRLGPF